MSKLKINAPDGKLLSIDIPEGTSPDQYDSIVENVVSDYTASQGVEEPGVIKSAALGAMSGIPGATAAVSGIEALGDKTYEEAHKSLEDLKDKAWEAHPVAYGGGKTAGVIGTALAAPVSIPGAVAVGGLAGLDAATKISDIPEEAVKGAALGGALGAAGKYVVEPVVGAATNLLSKAGKGAVASLGDKTTVEGVESYLKNPEAINQALTRPQLGTKIADTAADVAKASSHLSEEARNVLSPKVTTLSAKDLKDTAMEAVEKYYTDGNIATAADETAVKTIVDQYKRLADIAEANGGQIPETTLRSMIDRLQAATKESTYGNPEASASQDAIKRFSGKLNEALRKANPEYAEKMAPSAEMAKLSGDITDQFKLEKNVSGVLSPTDTTAGKIGNVTNPLRPEGAEVIERIKNATGQDLSEMIKNASTKESFTEPGSGGALKLLMTTLGYGTGRMTGVPMGGIAGATAGRFASESVNGGQVAKKILDAYIGASDKWNNSMLQPLVKKFGPVLVNAAKVGGNQLAATHFVLATSNPEYQKLIDHAQNMTDDTANTGIRTEE